MKEIMKKETFLNLIIIELYVKCIDVLYEQTLWKNIKSFITVDKIGFSQIKEIHMCFSNENLMYQKWLKVSLCVLCRHELISENLL